MKGNACYQKTDSGSETPDLLNKYVLKITQIAGISLKKDISKESLRLALSVPTLVSQLVNDKEYITKSEIEIIQKSLEDMDSVLNGKIDDTNAKLDDEINAREMLENVVNTLQILAHKHSNKNVLDTITEDRVAIWDKVKDLDKYFDYIDFKAFVEEIVYAYTNELQNLYTAIGITSYDGGIFGMEQSGAELDGGNFDSEPENSFDCGDFNPLELTAQVTSVIDCGTY